MSIVVLKLAYFTTMTPLRQEIDHAKSSSSSSTSTPMTSSTEISVDRQVRRDPYGMNHHPAIVSSESVERQVRGDPYSSETSEDLSHKPSEIPKSNKNENHVKTHIIPIFRNGCKNSERIFWMKELLNAETHTRVLSLEPTLSRQCLYSLPERPKL